MATAEQDYYELLGVARDASHAQIKQAFRRLARELHPDVSDDPDAAPRFRSITEAYEVLSDPERRQLYDRFGHAGLRRGGFAPMGADFGSLSDVFAAFFGALFYARQLSIPWLGGEGEKAITSLLWPNFEAGWPSNGPGDLGPRDDGTYEIIPAFGLPALNTALLLTSGLTITIAHHALKSGHRGILKVFLALTFLLGFVFLGVQAKEYGHAYHELGLQLGTGIYGSTFFMLTGFHGLHVCVGAIMLVVIWLRTMSGHFTPRHHFAFEAVAWYWHFVDVVWLGLFIFVYWL